MIDGKYSFRSYTPDALEAYLNTFGYGEPIRFEYQGYSAGGAYRLSVCHSFSSQKPDNELMLYEWDLSQFEELEILFSNHKRFEGNIYYSGEGVIINGKLNRRYIIERLQPVDIIGRRENDNKVKVDLNNFRLKNKKEEKITISEKKEKENTIMNFGNVFKNLKVGKAGSNYTLTFSGKIAYKGKVYEDGVLNDYSGMTIDGDMFYIIPSAKLEKGNIFEYNNTAYEVLEVNEVVVAIDLQSGEINNIVPTAVFGMNFYNVVVNPFQNAQMFGNNGNGGFNPLMLMLMLKDEDGGKSDKMLEVMLMSQMFAGGNLFANFAGLNNVEKNEK